MTSDNYGCRMVDGRLAATLGSLAEASERARSIEAETSRRRKRGDLLR